MKHPVRTAILAALAVNFVAFLAQDVPQLPSSATSDTAESASTPSGPRHDESAKGGRRIARHSALARALVAIRGARLPGDGALLPVSHEEHVATYPTGHQPHVRAVADYVQGTFAPRVRTCLSELEPVGAVEVTHSFIVTDDGMAVAAPIPNRTSAAVEVVDADMDPTDLPEVERCFAAAAAETSFLHVPLDDAFPSQPFVAHQTYRFARGR